MASSTGTGLTGQWLNDKMQTSGKMTGGHHYKFNENASQRDKGAAKWYDKFSREDDSEIIAENTGFSIEQIQQIRSHVFSRKHDLYDGYARFVPDYDMAVAWKRMRDGTPLPRDITLLKHELTESYIENNTKVDAATAHELATEKYDWWGQLEAETDGKGEPDGLL